MSYTMELLCHGGKCCAIKHIQGFSGRPDTLQAEAVFCNPFYDDEEDDDYPDPDDDDEVLGAAGQSRAAGKNFYIGKVPIESGRDRLDRFLKFTKKHQPKGLIEITLIAQQKVHWHDTLIERDFKIVQEFKNSNTGETIYLYHKINA